MRDPQRKIESSEVFADLVADMKRERPAPEALAKLLGAIDAMPDVPPASAKTASKTSLLLASTALIASLGAATILSREAPAQPDPSGATEARASESTTDPPAPAPALTSTHVADLPDAPMPASTPGPRSWSTRPAASASAAASGAGQEFEIVVAARRALTVGDHERCLSLVARYDREFAGGQFALEANVMRIEATAASGSPERAAGLARELLAREPRSPYEARLRSLLTTIEAHP